jgi:hypothetical protein
LTDRRKRMERALHGLAEDGVPETMDLWPAINERMAGRRASEARISEEPLGDATRRRARSPRLVPDSVLGWAFAALSVLILGAGVYASSGTVGEFFRQGLPGTVEPGSDEESGLRTQIDRAQTADGATVTLDWAYADEKFVMIGLDTQDLEGAQEPEEFGPDFGPILLQPSIYYDTVGDEVGLPPYVRITDASGQDFDAVGGGTLSASRAEVVFDAPEGLEPGRMHRFRLEVPLEKGDEGSGTPGEKPAAGPFVFHFEVPVRPAPTIELNREAEAKGITLTLERVINSPAQPQAVVCFRPPDDEHRWEPWVGYDAGPEAETPADPRPLGDGCWSVTIGAPVEGPSSVKVTELLGYPKIEGAARGAQDGKGIRGPWTFEFEAPAEAPGS